MLDAASELEVASSTQQQQVLSLLQEFAARGRTGRGRVVNLRFCLSPTEILADASGSARALTLERNRLEAQPDGSIVSRPTGQAETLEAGPALSAIGYAADRIPGVPFDERARLVANLEGRVFDPGTDRVVPNEYVVGWARTGPRGLIGSHRTGSAEVVARLLDDWRAGTGGPRELPPREAIDALLAERGVIPPAFGLAGVNAHTYTAWGSAPYWNAFVAVLEMHGKGSFFDPRLDDAVCFPVAARNRSGHVQVDPAEDGVTGRLGALQAYQLSIPAPRPPAGSFDAAAAKRGGALFAGRARCATCHVPPQMTEPGWNTHAPEEIGIGDFQASRSPDGRYRTTPLAASSPTGAAAITTTDASRRSSTS